MSPRYLQSEILMARDLAPPSTYIRWHLAIRWSIWLGLLMTSEVQNQNIQDPIISLAIPLTISQSFPVFQVENSAEWWKYPSFLLSCTDLYFNEDENTRVALPSDERTVLLREHRQALARTHSQVPTHKQLHSLSSWREHARTHEHMRTCLGKDTTEVAWLSRALLCCQRQKNQIHQNHTDSFWVWIFAWIMLSEFPDRSITNELLAISVYMTERKSTAKNILPISASSETHLLPASVPSDEIRWGPGITI